MRLRLRWLGLALGLLAVAIAVLAGLLAWQVRLRRPPVINGDLAFETLERERAPDAATSYFPRAEPGLVVLAGSADIASASPYLNSSALLQLRGLDWDQHLAIAVFRGYQARSVGGFAIERVVRQDAEVSVYASTGPVGEELIPTSPYHVISVRKVGRWGSSVTFRLYVDGPGEAARVTVEVPESGLPLWP